MDWFVGEIRLFGGNYAPEGWAFCNGGTYSITQYPALYALIGVTYGGDGKTTFAVPDLRSRLPLGVGKSPSTAGLTYAVGNTGGAENVTLTGAQLPAHSHQYMVYNTNGNLASPANAFLADTPDNLAMYVPYASANPTKVFADKAVDPTGGNAAHKNIMPTGAVNYIIALTGIFPSQN